ncbi:hypothetical protein LWI29_003228 [Acer saccharum]|uniref:Retrotransposon Copia-like N-terminal domain-containing protein n=1 Tax=Acer saccharum TaxID=4024 RepID=A0AA39RBX7_ACESA|nr:hypothetical protein LWI29_003228 [Acer saccharum]
MSEDSSTSNPMSMSTNNQPPLQPPFDQHSVQITNIKLNGDNFIHWSLSVKMYIHGCGKIRYLTSEKAEPDAKDSAHATWDAENSMVIAWLVNSIEEDINVNYLGYSNAKDMWDNLNLMYSNLGNKSQVYELQLKLGEIKQGTDTVTKYFATLKQLWQDIDMFNDYKWKDLENGAHYQNLFDNNRVFRFLTGLNVEFGEVRGRIIGRQPLPSINEMFVEV